MVERLSECRREDKNETGALAGSKREGGTDRPRGGISKQPSGMYLFCICYSRRPGT
jgi:hypothetical protein